MHKNNEYLKNILDDYKKYHGHIANQKNEFAVKFCENVFIYFVFGKSNS